MSKTEAKIISKPETTTASSATSDSITSDVVSTPTSIINISSSNNTATNASSTTSAIDKNREQNKELMNSNKEPIPTKKPNRNIIPPKIGLYNRTNYNLHVIFKKEDILFPPRKRTEKIYKEDEIVSVQGKTLQNAISLGLISIIR